MPPQVYNWTCSICATDWVLRATGLDPYSAREKVAVQIGYPSCVDEYSGLKNTQCLIPVFSDYGVEAVQEWVDWDRALEVCGTTTGVLNGLGWYHFVGISGASEDLLWIANSARGYQGVYDTISRAQFDQLGPWQVVRLVQ
jgi:hypothetical protein